MKKILYLGSGKSSIYHNNQLFDDYIKIGVNNTWKLFTTQNPMDVWIHSGDFPRENFPREPVFHKEVSYKDYSESCKLAEDILGWKTESNQHYAGYTIFFQGLYWIMMNYSPCHIGLLGFDHDYNPEKTKKWLLNGKPNIQNNFNNKNEKTIEEWTDTFFENFEPDFFYGHGVPDPLMLGTEHILQKMNLSLISAKTLGSQLFNYSNVESNMNPIPKLPILFR